MSSLPLPAGGKGENIWKKYSLLERYIINFFVTPHRFLLVYWLDFIIPIRQFLKLHYVFQIAKILFEGRGEICS